MTPNDPVVGSTPECLWHISLPLRHPENSILFTIKRETDTEQLPKNACTTLFREIIKLSFHEL